MPYQVRFGSLTVVATTAREALELFDRMAEGGDAANVVIRDMDGKRVDPLVLRRKAGRE